MCVKLSKFLEYLCEVLSFSIVVAAVAHKSLVEAASLVIAHGEGEERAEELSCLRYYTPDPKRREPPHSKFNAMKRHILYTNLECGGFRRFGFPGSCRPCSNESFYLEK